MRDEESNRVRDPSEAPTLSSDIGAEVYWTLAVLVADGGVEAVGAHLLQLGFSAFEERSAPRGTRVIVYSESEERLREVARELLSRQSEIGALACDVTQLGSEWQLAWTQHLTPVQLTPQLRIVPGAPVGAPDPADLHLELAFAFGFGEHPSTRLIAGWVEQACRRRPGASLLDVGSGTGVLALVAARSGAARVLGIDTSLSAVQAAARNAALNGVSQTTFMHGSIDGVEPAFDLVVANIEAPVLIELCPAIARRIAPRGAIALAGLIAEQEGDVQSAYARAGVELALRAREGEWSLLASE